MAVILLFLIVLPIITAIEITFSKDSYQPKETLQAEITGNFISLTSDNVFIFKDDKLHSEPVIKDLTKQNNIYYFYAILPNTEGNFTFQIDAEYLERGVIKNEPIKKSIDILYKNESDLSINPGFLIPSEKFFIKVKSLYRNTDLTAKFEATGETKELFLIEEIEEIIKFSLPELLPMKSSLTINNYKIPVFLIKKLDKEEILKIEFIPYSLSGTIIENKDYFFRIVVKNAGNKNITDIKFSSDLNTKIFPEQIDLLEPDGIRIINLTISVEKVDDENLSGKIIAKFANDSFNLPVLFEITKNESDVKIDDSQTIKDRFSCSELGVICQGTQVCTGETTESLEGPCCIGQCIEQKKSSYSTYLGIILLIVLILIIIYVIWKVRKRNKIKSPKEILRERSNRFEDRMKGREVSGGLDRV